MNLETRIEKLEQEINKDNKSDSNLELFDIHGGKVDAKIVKMPMDWERGLAVLQDGTEIPIAPVGNWQDIIFASEQLLNSEDFRDYENKKPDQTTQKDFADMLFLRKNGIQSAVEIICGAQNV